MADAGNGQKRWTHHPWLNGIAAGLSGAIVAAALAFALDRTTDFTIQFGEEPNTVTAQDRTVTLPAPTVTVTRTVTVSPESPNSESTRPVPRLTYLADLEHVSSNYNGGWEFGTREVYGRQVTESLIQGIGCGEDSASPNRVEWNLGGTYDRFIAWAGLDAESESNTARARFTVMVDDDEVLEFADVGLREHKEFAVKLEGHHRLILEARMLSGDSCQSAYAVWGEVALARGS